MDLQFSEDELNDKKEQILSFLGKQMEAAGASIAVLGLSGGIDSTLTAYLTVEALGPNRVNGLVMPGEVSRDRHMSDAEQVAEELEITYEVIEIDTILQSFLEAYPAAREDREAVGNARARIRAVLNYLVANHREGLVIGTGNRTELVVGYFTKYGDGAVDCLPIGNLYKQQVRQMARHMGIPEKIVTKTPSAELWAGQTDEEELGMDYDTLDRIIVRCIDGDHTIQETARKLNLEEKVVKRVRQLYDQSKHKRTMPPVPE